MYINHINILLFPIFIYIVIQKTYSFTINRQETIDDLLMEPHTIQPSLLLNKPINLHISPFLSNRRSESAENYFNWVEKTQRPVEFLRGKRFWLFAKKDENDMSTEFIPPVNIQQSSLTQGLWRSGIVGRRR